MAFSDVAIQIEETISKAKKEAEVAFLAELKDIFVRHPELKVIKWPQYVPGFNDGDACEFSLGEIVVSNEIDISNCGEWDEDEAGDEPENLIAFTLGYDEPTEYADLKPLGKFMNSHTGQDILEFIFGINIEVIVTATGVETEEYDCGY
jgi:hypothetical protein